MHHLEHNKTNYEKMSLFDITDTKLDIQQNGKSNYQLAGLS